MAVFTRPESEGLPHCEVMAYFSPAAQKVAEAFEAKPCEHPARAGLGLLIIIPFMLQARNCYVVWISMSRLLRHIKQALTCPRRA